MIFCEIVLFTKARDTVVQISAINSCEFVNVFEAPAARNFDGRVENVLV